MDLDVLDGINSIYTIIITLITVLGSAAAWKYYDNRAIEKKEMENFIKTDCKERIDKLEILLERSAGEKDDLRDKVLELTAMVSELKVKINFLELENERLKRLM